MNFTKGQLVAILGCTQALEDKYITQINAACAKYSINTMLRLAAFIAQVGHESGRLATITENLNYSADGLLKYWPNRFTAATASAAARQPQKIANIVYASRMGNGNEASGEGWKYRGRGLIQITGKSNYDAYSQSSGFNALSNPDALLEPQHASMSAAWFWDSKSLNAYADRSDFATTTKRINGGTNGQADRELLYKKAIIVLSGGVPPKDEDVDKAPLPAPASGSPTSSVSNQKTPGAQNSSIVEPRALQVGESKSKYPWNFVNVSRSGHITEVDDTPGYERLNMTHRTGSYWEIDNTGTYTIKSILDSYKVTKYDSYDYVGGNYTQQVKGQSYRQSDGDMIFKSNGTVFVNAGKVQMNTGMLAVSGEINSPNINAQIFGGMGGLAFGDLLAKQSLVAYDIIKGTAPMLGSSLGFKSAPGATEPGSADGQMSNDLSNKAPNGTPWITNGVRNAANVVSAVAMAKGVADLLKSTKPDEYVQNATNSAASSLDSAATKKSSETPVFLKHVTFDKPTLISQSTTLNKPDPALYVNNLHTIVNSSGRGRLHMSNGVEWVPIGDAAQADHDYTDDQIAVVIDKINRNEVSTIDKILAEAQERANAILNEARARQQALEEEARVRQQAIVNGVLAEAVARGAAIQAESIIRQSAEESLSNRVLELTASTSEDIAAAMFEERQARTTAIEAEAFLRETLATKFDENVASITESLTTLSNETSASTEKLNFYISSNDESIASFKVLINTKVDDQGNALSSRIDSQQAANEHNAAMIESESTIRLTEDTALATRIDTVFAETDNNAAAIQNEVTARTNADSALATSLDTMIAKVIGLAQGTNLLPNAGFKVVTTDGTNQRPNGWTYDSSTSNGAISDYNAQVLPDGPDGYNFVRVNTLISTGTSSARFGIRIEDGDALTPQKIRPNISYILAARFRTTNDADVGKLVNMTDTNFPFESTVISGDGVLTKEWKWFILSIKYTNLTYTHRDYYLNYFYGNSTGVGGHSFDIATPLLAEGTAFLGFNLGEDQRILVNTAAITNEQTVRAQADGALATRIDTVSSQTEAAAKTADWSAVYNKPIDATNLVLTPTFEDGTLRTWINSPGVSILATQLGSPTFPNKYFLRVSTRDTIELGNHIPVRAGEKFYVSSSFYTGSTTYPVALGLAFYNSAGALVAFASGARTLPGSTGWVSISGSLVCPESVVYASPWIQIDGFDNIGTAGIANMLISRSEPGSTVGATWGVDVKGADAVIAELTNIASDNVLSKGEKSTVLLNWNAVDAEVNQLRNQADAFGVSRVPYDTAYQQLSEYLSYSIGPYNGAWADTSLDSPIDGATFRSKWTNYYAARQNISNAITTRAKALADQGAATNAASIVRVENAMTTADQANASAIQSVSTTVAGHTTTIQQNTTSIQGVQANYGVKINNNGYISGFGLLSEPVNGNIVSTFDILADRFKIQSPGVNGGVPVIPFSVDSTTNPPTISLNGNIQIGGATGGKNRAYNSGPSPRTIDGYFVRYNTTGLGPSDFNQSFGGYKPAGSGGVYLHFASTPPNGSVCDIDNDNRGVGYPVNAGGRYEASVYLSNHRCATAIGIIFVDANNNYISEIRGNQALTPSTDAYPLSSWGRSWVVGNAPGNAVKCYLNIRTYYSGQNDPYTFCSMIYFGEAGSTQTQPSAWSPSGVTSIMGGMIETDSLSAISATIGTLQSRTSGARVQIKDDIIKVFNDSNVTKVKLGNLAL